MPRERTAGDPGSPEAAARGRRPVVIALIVLAALAWASYAVRRAAIRRFFVDGVPSGERTLEPDTGVGLPPASRTRVVLLDGLSRAHAATLPNLGDTCAQGLDLAVDVGFPTVSLPVQHALWTGRTQQESGVQYRIGRIDPPPADSLAARVAGSVAVAESHRDIVHSFGFGTALPGIDDDAIEAPDSAWRAQGFLAAAVDAVRSESPLVFVHVLRIDEAGHAAGGASPAYADAASAADAMLATMLDAAPPSDATRWFVLADHGHRPGGGHGDAEEAIRVVRACVVGGVARAEHDDPIHLVDFHRAIADSVGLSPIERSGARSLAAALADPRPAASLPVPRTREVAVGGMLALAMVFLAVQLAGLRSWVGLLWPIVAAVSTLAIHGAITLSNPVVYPPFGRDVLLSGLPGFSLLALALVRRNGEHAPARLVAALLLPAAGMWLCTGWICGVPAALFGGPPPLLPRITAWHSVLATLLAGGFATAALVALGSMIVQRVRPR